MSYLPGMSLNEGHSEMRNCGNLRSLVQGDIAEEKIICPKPQRVAVATFRSVEFMKPMRQLRSMSPVAVDGGDVGCEIMEIFLSKGTLADSPKFGCSPPFFTGSPPSRASNPLVRDAEFLHPMASRPSPILVARPSASPVGQTSTNSQSKGVAGSPSLRARGSPSVRIEGFECSGHGFECTGREAGRRVYAFA